MLDLVHHSKPCFEPSCFELLPSEIVGSFRWLVLVVGRRWKQTGLPFSGPSQVDIYIFWSEFPNGGTVICYWPNESFICCFLLVNSTSKSLAADLLLHMCCQKQIGIKAWNNVVGILFLRSSIGSEQTLWVMNEMWREKLEWWWYCTLHMLLMCSGHFYIFNKGSIWLDNLKTDIKTWIGIYKGVLWLLWLGGILSACLIGLTFMCCGFKGWETNLIRMGSSRKTSWSL